MHDFQMYIINCLLFKLQETLKAVKVFYNFFLHFDFSKDFFSKCNLYDLSNVFNLIGRKTIMYVLIFKSDAQGYGYSKVFNIQTVNAPDWAAAFTQKKVS